MTRDLALRRHGSTLGLLVVLMPVVMAVAAYSINLVYMELARTELQIATDLATRAAGRTLRVTGSEAEAIAAADRLLSANPYVNQTLGISGADIVFGVSTRDSEAQRYKFDVGKQPNAVRMRSFGSRDVPLIFPTMGAPVPFRPIKQAIATQVELDIALVLDRSGSMAYASDESSNTTDPPASAPAGWTFGQAAPTNSRWRDTVAAVDAFLTLLEESYHNEQVSLSTYSHDTTTDVKLTREFNEIRAGLDLHSQQFEGGATNIGDGLKEGAAALIDKKRARTWASRVIIVLSDGIHNTGTPPIPVAQLLAPSGVTIYTITFSNEADKTQMATVSQIGGGKHYHATGPTELVNAFEDIANSLPTLITY